MERSVKVRKAEPGDKEWVIGTAARRMLEEELQRPEFFNEENCQRLFDIGISNGVILVAEENGVPIGCISGIYCPNMFNNALITLQEIFWYVLPTHRNGRAGLCLLNEFCEIGKSTAHDTFMSLLDTSEVSQRMLSKKGFVFKEIAFVMKGNP